jgi:hypothetical protein
MWILREQVIERPYNLVRVALNTGDALSYKSTIDCPGSSTFNVVDPRLHAKLPGAASASPTRLVPRHPLSNWASILCAQLSKNLASALRGLLQHKLFLQDPISARYLLLRALDRRYGIVKAYQRKLDYGLVERAHYGHCMLNAAILARSSIPASRKHR